MTTECCNIDEIKKLIPHTTIDNAKFRKPVIPGDVMSLVISVKRIRNKLWKFYGQVMVNSQRVSECEFSAMMRI